MEKTISISNKTVINAIAGVLFEMHPYHNPEGIDAIIEEIEGHFNELDEKHKNNTFKLIRFTSYNEFYKELKKWLKNIKEFNDLNISRKLKDQGVVDVEDERNKGFVACDRYTVKTNDSRYSDFIDLDAAIRNIVNQIGMINDYSDDCFLCKNATEYGSMEPGQTICETCTCNPKMSNKRETHPMALKPHNQWTEEEKKMYNLD